ncbi:MAG: methyltransferase domain-containing protein [Caulobacteraceae bacterium]|nr:methyltransferase domain-containing protein [Caulobacteraceae bacterium]
MRRDVVELREFYAQPLGEAVRETLTRKVFETWGDAPGVDMLGLGYATPFLEPFLSARRVTAAMPMRQGVEPWPAHGRRRSCLVDEAGLPFPTAMFDRVLVVHGLEEADSPAAMLAEIGRVLSGSGRVIIAAAARGGLWAHAEKTPFGHGRPFTRGQLERLVRAADLEPTAWSQALYVPPWRQLADWAENFEQVGSRIWPGAAGLILMEACKRQFAARAEPAANLLESLIPEILHPAPAPTRRAVERDAEPA